MTSCHGSTCTSASIRGLLLRTGWPLRPSEDVISSLNFALHTVVPIGHGGNLPFDEYTSDALPLFLASAFRAVEPMRWDKLAI